MVLSQHWQAQLGFNICCAPHQLLLCCGLCKISIGPNLAPESFCTISVSGTFRAHRSLLPISQSPIRLIVMGSSTPSLTRHLSHGTWAPAKSGGDRWHDLYVLLVMCGHDVFVVASAINNIDCHVAQPNVASRNDNTKVFDQCICCNGGRRETSFIARAMALHCNGEGLQLAQSIFSECIDTFTIVKFCGPVTHCGKGLVVASYTYVALRPFVARGSLSSCTTCVANRPCGEGLIDVPIPVTILGKQFVVTLFGKGLIPPFLDECGLLGILNVLPYGAVHAVFDVLALLNIGDVHTFSNVLAVLNLGIFTLLVIALCDMVITVSCKQQHESLIIAWEFFCSSLTFIFYCHCSLQYNIKK
jgi:hypothetical protein